MSRDDDKPKSLGRAPSKWSASLGSSGRVSKESRPTLEEIKVIERLTRELVKRGDFRIRFVERLEEEGYPTLLFFVALPRGTQAGDPEILQLHEVANQISESSSIDVMITVSAVSGRGWRLQYESAEIAMSIGSEVLADLPNFFASAALLRSSMKMTTFNDAKIGSSDLFKNLLSLAEVFFYLGHQSESFEILEKLELILGKSATGSNANIQLDFSSAFSVLNKVALLYAQFQEYGKACSIIDQNFERLRSFVDTTKVLERPDEMDALSLPRDITFARQELREKVQFYRDKHAEIPSLCKSVIDLLRNGEQ